jgi:hypothetical protein
LHTPDLDWHAELLAKQMKMPLMQYYRQLRLNRNDGH